MIVFDLRCGASHIFEAWFGTSRAYEEQRAAGLLACPLCGSTEVGKAVMAPNIAAKNRAVAVPDAPPPPSTGAMKAALQALASAQASALDKSEWVGRGFADRARAMHAGDVVAGPIHGQATRAEARELVEEGVPIIPLPLPVVPPEALN